MEVLINVQGTPNPNALKFIINKDVIEMGRNATFSSPSEARGINLAEKLLGIASVSQVYFFENVITVTQDGSGDWGALTGQAEKAIQECMPTHDPGFIVPGKSENKIASIEDLNPEIAKINGILDRSIRPFLQGDGGDLEVVSYSDHILRVFYQGACGSCPSSTTGTLYAIQSILRDEFDPEIEVIAG